MIIDFVERVAVGASKILSKSSHQKNYLFNNFIILDLIAPNCLLKILESAISGTFFL